MPLVVVYVSLKNPFMMYVLMNDDDVKRLGFEVAHERNYEQEHESAVKTLREKEEQTGEREIKQKNEGQFIFHCNEEKSPGNILLEVELSRHLDSSLMWMNKSSNFVGYFF